MLFCVIGDQGPCFAIAAGLKAFPGQSKVFHQVPLHTHGPSLRELLVVSRCTEAVGMTLDEYELVYQLSVFQGLGHLL